MALIPCPECKKRISETAESCPKCGCELTPEKVEEVKQKEKKLQTGIAIGCLIPILLFFVILMCPQKSPTPRQSERSTTARRQIGQEKPEVTRYKVQYRLARREYETTQSNYNQNSSASNKQAWDDAANKLDRAYLRLEKAMGAEPHKGVTKQRKELEAFIRRVKSEAK